MRRQILMASAALVLAYARPALAQEVSPADAESIQQTLTRYLPQEMIDAGLVTVKAASSIYELRFDPAVLLGKAQAGGAKVEGLKPMTAYLRPMPEGTYRIEASDSFDIKGTIDAAPGRNSFSYLVDSMTFDGVYDPEIFYFTSADWTTKHVAFTSTSQQESVTARFSETEMRLAAEKKAPGTIDITSTGVMKAFAQTITGGKNGRVDIGADRLDIDVRMDGARYKPFKDLVLFVLDNMHKKELNDAETARLKDLMRAVSPVFDNLAETIKASNVTIGTDRGTFGARSVTYDLHTDGIAPSTRVGFGLSVDGPTLPPGLVPPAFAEAVPDRATFKAAIKDLDISGVFSYYLEHADFSRSEPLTQDEKREAGRIVLPGGAMTVEFEEVSAVSPIYDVHLTGTMLLYPEEKDRRSADVTVTMRQFDKTVAYLQKNAAAVPQFGQAAFGLLMMKGLARDAGGGAQAWDIKVGEDGKVLINGQPLPFQP